MNKVISLDIPIIFLTITKINRIQYINNTISELKKLKYTNFDIFYGVDIPFLEQITKDILKYSTNNIDHTDNYYLNPSIFNCMLNHYMIVKRYFELGYDSIIVIEDDCLIRNLSTLMRCLNNIPNDADIARLSVENCKLDKDLKINNFFYKQHEHTQYYNSNYGSMLFNIYFRNGMKFYIDYINNNGYIPSDHPLMNTSNINHYIIPGYNSPLIHLSKKEVLSLLNVY